MGFEPVEQKIMTLDGKNTLATVNGNGEKSMASILKERLRLRLGIKHATQD